MNPIKMIVSLRQGVKTYTSSLVVDKSKLGAFYNVCFGSVGSLVADMARCQATKPNQPCVRCL